MGEGARDCIRNETNMEKQQERKPVNAPVDREAELHVCGHVILFGTLPQGITDAHFWHDDTQRIYQTLVAMNEAKELCSEATTSNENIVRLARRLQRWGVLDEIGGLPKLVDVMGACTNQIYLDHNVNILRRMKFRRDACGFARKVYKQAIDPLCPEEKIVETIKQGLSKPKETK